MLIALIPGMVFVAAYAYVRDTIAPAIPEGVLGEDHETLDPEELEDFVQEILAHLNRWMGKTLNSEGWLHIVTSHDYGKDQPSSLPSGQIIPADYIKDTWYLLNETAPWRFDSLAPSGPRIMGK